MDLTYKEMSQFFEIIDSRIEKKNRESQTPKTYPAKIISVSSDGLFADCKILTTGDETIMSALKNKTGVVLHINDEVILFAPLGDLSNIYIDKSKSGTIIDGQNLAEFSVGNSQITLEAIDDSRINGSANIDGAKLNISSVIAGINSDGTTTIEGSKVYLDNKTLDVKMQEVEINVTYKVDIISSNGGVFKNGQISTTLMARVYHGAEDVTDTIDANRFRWTRVSSDTEGDVAWNTSHYGGMKQITVTQIDVFARATFNCEILDS